MLDKTKLWLGLIYWVGGVSILLISIETKHLFQMEGVILGILVATLGYLIMWETLETAFVDEYHDDIKKSYTEFLTKHKEGKDNADT